MSGGLGDDSIALSNPGVIAIGENTSGTGQVLGDAGADTITRRRSYVGDSGAGTVAGRDGADSIARNNSYVGRDDAVGSATFSLSLQHIDR